MLRVMLLIPIVVATVVLLDTMALLRMALTPLLYLVVLSAALLAIVARTSKHMYW